MSRDTYDLPDHVREWLHPDTVFYRWRERGYDQEVIEARRRDPRNGLVTAREHISMLDMFRMSKPEIERMCHDVCNRLDRMIQKAIDDAKQMLDDSVLAMNHAAHLEAHREFAKYAGVHPVSRGQAPPLTIVQDPHAPPNTAYFLNPQYIKHDEPSKITLDDASRLLREMYEPAIRAQLTPSITNLFPDIQPTPEEDPMSDFNRYPIYLTNAQEEAARRGTMTKAEALAVITEVLPLEVILVPGMRYQYDDGNQNTYEIVRVENATAIIRRCKANSAGLAGEINEEAVDRIVRDIRTGRAVIL